MLESETSNQLIVYSLIVMNYIVVGFSCSCCELMITRPELGAVKEACIAERFVELFQ